MLCIQSGEDADITKTQVERAQNYDTGCQLKQSHRRLSSRTRALKGKEARGLGLRKTKK